jgi:hypothetical protein
MLTEILIEMLAVTLASGGRWPTARASPSWRAWLTGPLLSGSWRQVCR